MAEHQPERTATLPPTTTTTPPTNLPDAELDRVLAGANPERSVTAIHHADALRADAVRRTAPGGLGFDLKWNLGWMHDTLGHLARDPVHRAWHHDTGPQWWVLDDGWPAHPDHRGVSALVRDLNARYLGPEDPEEPDHDEC